MARSVNEVSSSDILQKKELFFAELAHDLKNPIDAQLLSLKMLSDGAFGRLNSEQNEIIEIILESTNYMHNMLHTILNMYKYSNCIISLTKSKFSAKDLIQNCINEIKHFACHKNIEIIFEIKNKNVEILADIIQLRRVISNLLNNALNYSFENSCLYIKIDKESDIMIFEFENSGPEITDDVKKHIFEKYFSSSKIGTGLGLYFSRKIIEAHDGKIYLNAKGTSNKFIFEIPINNSKQASIVL